MTKHRILVTGGDKVGKSYWINQTILGERLLTSRELRLPIFYDVLNGKKRKVSARFLENDIPSTPLTINQHDKLVEEMSLSLDPQPVLMEWHSPVIKEDVLISERNINTPFDAMDDPPDTIILLVPSYGMDNISERLARHFFRSLRNKPEGIKKMYVTTSDADFANSDILKQTRDMLRKSMGPLEKIFNPALPPVEEWSHVE